MVESCPPSRRGLATGAFVTTFLSAVAAIGVSGYASRFGWAAAVFACYGYATGRIVLVVAAKRMHRCRLTTVPEFLRSRYETLGLGTLAALTTSAGSRASPLRRLVF